MMNVSVPRPAFKGKLSPLLIVQAPHGRQAARGIDCRGDPACLLAWRAKARGRIISQATTSMTTFQKPVRPAEPATLEEMIVDIRKRLGRIERDLISLLQGQRPAPRRMPENGR